MAAPGTLNESCSVKTRGLPFKASVEDILEFFSGFSLDSSKVFLTRHPDGRPNGEAFIVFDSPAEARRATSKDRHEFNPKFGDRYVRVYPTLESDLPDMQAAAAQQSMPQASPSHPQVQWDSVVKIKSLPFDATQLDIIHFFEGFKLKPNGVQLVVRADYKPTGEAFVDFESAEEAGRAIREKDHKVFAPKFGDRYVRLIQVSRKEMQATLALRFGGEGILKMKGIPFKATAADVRKFFSNYKVKPDGISFIMHADGRPTGMAFIEFETPQEAVRAMEKDRAKFGPEYGDRFCMLQLVGRHEMDKVTLQKESETAPAKLLNMMALQAAALAGATQAAALNPALQPLLNLAGANPWLHMGLPSLNPAATAALAGAQLGHLQHSGLASGAGGAVSNQLLESVLAAQLGMGAAMGNGLNNGHGLPSGHLANGHVNGLADGHVNGLTNGHTLANGGLANGLTNGHSLTNGALSNGLNNSHGLANGALANGLSNGHNLGNGLANGLGNAAAMQNGGLSNGLNNSHGLAGSALRNGLASGHSMSSAAGAGLNNGAGARSSLSTSAMVPGPHHNGANGLGLGLSSAASAPPTLPLAVPAALTSSSIPASTLAPSGGSSHALDAQAPWIASPEPSAVSRLLYPSALPGFEWTRTDSQTMLSNQQVAHF